MTRDEIFNILKPIVQSVTGLQTVILADELDASGVGRPSPNGEYITIEPKQSLTQRGQANIHRSNSATDQSVDVDVRAQVIVEASINCFRGRDAITRVSRLQQCNKRPDVSATLRSAKLGWQRVSSPNNLTRLQSGNPEQRAQCYIYLYYEMTATTVTMNAIESAGWEAYYDTDPRVVSVGETLLETYRLLRPGEFGLYLTQGDEVLTLY